MGEFRKQNYNQPILVKHASLRDLTANGSYSQHRSVKGGGDHHHHHSGFHKFVHHFKF